MGCFFVPSLLFLFSHGVPSPRFYLSPSSPPLSSVFSLHSHIDPYAEVRTELSGLNASLSQVLGSDHPLLERIANYFFETGGKRIRPTIVFLMARALEKGVREDVSRRVDPYSVGYTNSHAAAAATSNAAPIFADQVAASPSAVDSVGNDLPLEITIPSIARPYSHPPTDYPQEQDPNSTAGDNHAFGNNGNKKDGSHSGSGASISDFIFNPAAAAASAAGHVAAHALDAASTFVSLAPKLSPVPLPPLPPLVAPILQKLPPLPFAPFSYDSASLTQKQAGIAVSQRRLAEIIEMIHTASLLHDDVIDEADTRRNVPTLNKLFGNKLSILAGDYLLARASVSLARLRDPLVTESISSIIEHLVKGEIMQLKPSLLSTLANSGNRKEWSTQTNYQYVTISGHTQNGTSTTTTTTTYQHRHTARSFHRGEYKQHDFHLLDKPPSSMSSFASLSSSAASSSSSSSSSTTSELSSTSASASSSHPTTTPLPRYNVAFRADLSHYLTKSYYKTASILSSGCYSCALLGGYAAGSVESKIAEEYGKNLGLAFQIIDDLLDVTSVSATTLGKPIFSDLSNGVITAPVLFALEVFPQEVTPIIQRRASQTGDRAILLSLLQQSDAILKTQQLAEECATAALAAIIQLKPSRAQSALITLLHKVLTREK